MIQSHKKHSDKRIRLFSQQINYHFFRLKQKLKETDDIYIRLKLVRRINQLISLEHKVLKDNI